VVRNDKALGRVVEFLVDKGIAFQNDRVFSNVLGISNLAGAKGRIVESAILDMKDVMIQDWASLAVLEALNVARGDVIIDACAAPFRKPRDLVALRWIGNRRGDGSEPRTCIG